jgi:alpha-methylacyl-CoA racemase
MSEAATHPHNVARRTFVDVDGVTQPAPAPRFSRTVPEITEPPAFPGQHSREILEEWGVAKDRIDELVESGAVIDT